VQAQPRQPFSGINCAPRTIPRLTLPPPRRFPYKIGYDAAGTVAATGTSVTSLKVGDEVYSRIPSDYKGSAAEYTLSQEYAVAKKPAQLSFTEAAGLPLVGLTALQAMRSADSLLEGGLEGKTVFVPAGLSGTGSVAVQLAKNVFGAAKVITTLSTGKIAKAKEIFGDDGTLQIVDYTKEDVVKAVGKGQVDYMFDTMGHTLKVLPILKSGGVIVSIGTMPSGDQAAKGMPDMPYFFRVMLNLVDWYYRWQAGRSGVKYSYIFMSPDAKGLNDFATWVQEGKIKPVVGRTAKFSDIDAVRKGCQEVYDGKGGIGKFVIEMD
jgi:NADPH:quinone reductase-like Zn-dependent oxidoreductase